MLNPDHVEKVGELLRDFKAFQKKFDDLLEEEAAFKATLIELIADHLITRKQLRPLEIIRHLDRN